MAKFDVKYDPTGDIPRRRILVTNGGNEKVNAGNELQWKIPEKENANYKMKINVALPPGVQMSDITHHAPSGQYERTIKFKLKKPFPNTLDWFKYDIEMNQSDPGNPNQNDHLDPVIIVGGKKQLHLQFLIAGISLAVGIFIGLAVG